MLRSVTRLVHADDEEADDEEADEEEADDEADDKETHRRGRLMYITTESSAPSMSGHCAARRSERMRGKNAKSRAIRPLSSLGSKTSPARCAAAHANTESHTTYVPLNASRVSAKNARSARHEPHTARKDSHDSASHVSAGIRTIAMSERMLYDRPSIAEPCATSMRSVRPVRA
jgi:hypothetical protein